ncbi:MAG: tape measure protein [Cohaesibacter sp.]|jgi:hypothetical protein|nr:tape measure protein [Cohaesibacter sp.]
MSMRLGIVAEFSDRASKRMKKLLHANSRMEKLNKANAKMAKAQATQTKANAAAQTKLASQVSRTNRLMSALKAAASGIASVIGRAAAAMVRFTGSISTAIRKVFSLKAALSRVRRGAGMIGSGAGKMARGAMVGAGLAMGATAAAAGVANMVIGPAAQVEQYQTILETTEGTAKAAQKALSWVTDFAVKTPYELETVMESFTRLRAYGLDPTNGMLKTLGDTSAAMGKPIMQAVEAMADAVTGENERLKEFGIKAKKAGKYFYYEYTQNGVSKIAKVLASDRAAIQKTLTGIFDAKYGGSMERLSKTWNGMVSNMSDMWFKFRLMISQSGVFDWAKEKLRGFLDLLNNMEADGTLAVMAKTIGDNIIATLQAAWTFGTELWAIMQELGGWLQFAADALGGWNRLVGVFVALPLLGTIMGIVTGFAQLAGGLMLLGSGLAVLSWPIVAVIAGMTALAAAAYLIYDNWDAITQWFGSIWDWIVEKASAAWNWFKTNLSWHPLALIANNWGAITDWFANFWNQIKSSAQSGWDGIKTVWAAFEWNSVIPNLEWSDLLMLTLPGAIAKIIDAFTGLNLYDAGVKAIQSLWNGMLSLVDKLVASIRAKLSAMLPSWAANMVGASGGDAGGKLQKHATGGSFGPGPLLVGERGPELEYSNRSGFIAHNGQLQHMARLSERIRKAAVAGSVALGVASPSLAASAPSAITPSSSAVAISGKPSGASNGAAGSNVQITYSPTIHVGEGAAVSREDIMELLEEQADDLLELIERKLSEQKRLDF